MSRTARIATVNEYNKLLQLPTLHPLVSVIDFSKITIREQRTVDFLSFGFYSIFLKQDESCIIRYGRNTYDYQEGTLVFIAPEQQVSIEADPVDYRPSGKALLFHPDLLSGTSLGRKIRNYPFFSYDVHEALHLSEKEIRLTDECFVKILSELELNLDKHSNNLIVANIELFLDYCMRFYDRQFITREKLNKGILRNFEEWLNNYFHSGRAREEGIPAVNLCAAEQHLSPNYFSELVKKEAGISAQEYIQRKIIQLATEMMAVPEASLNEIAFELGYKYPQHFTRLFKKQTGSSPSAFRDKLN